jgi:O-antigen/teichoic acid export membrane protein
MIEKAVASTVEGQAEPKTAFGPWLQRASRLGRYSVWSGLDQFINIGLPRLVLFPLLAWLMPDEFGVFVLALSFVQMVGLTPSNGLAGYVIRDFARHDPEHQRLMMRTVLFLSGLIMLPFGLFFLFGGGWLGRVYQSPDLGRMLPLLGIYLLLMNVVETALTMFRVHRAFSRPAFFHLVQLLLLFTSIPFYKLWGLPGVALAHAIGNIPVLVLLFVQEPAIFCARPYFSREMAGSALRVWLPYSASAFIFVSAGYLDRPLLGYWWPEDEVAIFFAAVSTAGVVIIPAMFTSQLVLSLLGKSTGIQGFSRRFLTLYALGTIVSAAALFFVVAPLGRLVLTKLYSGIAEQALPLWNYAVAAYTLMHIQALCRPFITKFLSPNIIPVLAFASVVARVLPMLWLVPRFGKTGAVQAMLIGSAVAALLWLGTYVLYFIGPRSRLPEQGPVGEQGEDRVLLPVEE